MDGVRDDHAPGAEDLERLPEDRAVLAGHVGRELPRPHHAIAIVHAQRRVWFFRLSEEPGSDLAVDAIDAVSCPSRHNSTVYEHGLAKLEDHRELGEAAGVWPAWHQGGAARARVWRKVAQPRVVDLQTGHCFPGGKRIRSDGLVVEPPAEDFVVADERVDCAAGLPGPALKLEQEVEHLPFLVAATDQVAQLHDGQRAADPLVAGVDGDGRSQGHAEGVEIGVDVSDGDDTAAAGGLGARGAPCDGNCEQERPSQSTNCQHVAIVRQQLYPECQTLAPGKRISFTPVCRRRRSSERSVTPSAYPTRAATSSTLAPVVFRR